MIASKFIFIVTSIPIIIVFACVLFSQYYALSYTSLQIKLISEELFNTEVMYSRQITQMISSQFNSQMQKFSYYINMINSKQSKIFSGKVLFKEPHISTQMNTEMKYINQEDPKLIALYKKRPFLTCNWYHQNITKINELPKQTQDLLYNLSRIEPLSRTLAVLNVNEAKRYNKYIKFDNIVQGYNIEDIGYTASNNVTFKNLVIGPGCRKGKFNFDAHCRSWYKAAIPAQSISINQPTFYFGTAIPYVNSLLCQKLMQYNKTSDSDMLKTVLCLGVKLESLQEYFRNYAKSTVQSYLIDPISQIVVYDSNREFDKYSTKPLTELEFKYLLDQNEAKKFNDTLKSNFTSYLYKSLPKMEKTTLNQLYDLDVEFEYIRNETKNYVFISPIYVIDKLPYYSGIKKEQKKGYNIQFIFAQINIISNESLDKKSKDLQQFFNKYYLIVSICLICFGVISLFITILYSIKIKNLFNETIIHLVKILKKMQQEQESNQLHNYLEEIQQNSDDMFLSYETKELYESFKMVFQQLLCTSENFFLTDQTDTLLRLYRNIEFFKQFRNDYAVGITHNNIGSILLQQGHYFQALEHYQTAILFAKYEIQNFCQKYSYSTSAEIISEYSFKSSVQREDDKGKVVSIQAKFSNASTKQNEIYKSKITKDYSEVYQKRRSTEKSRDDCISPIPMFDTTFRFDEALKNNFKSTHYTTTQINKNSNLNQSNMLASHWKSTNLQPQTPVEQTDDFIEERIQLLSSLYYRQQNYITTLIAFQESNDEIKQKNNTSIDYICFNFWKEIENLLKQQIRLCNHLPFGNTERVELLALVSKCYFQIDEIYKADSTLKCAEQLLRNLQKTTYQQSGIEQQQLDLNLSESKSNFQIKKQSSIKKANTPGKYNEQTMTTSKQHVPILKQTQQGNNDMTQSVYSSNKLKMNVSNIHDNVDNINESLFLQEKQVSQIFNMDNTNNVSQERKISKNLKSSQGFIFKYGQKLQENQKKNESQNKEEDPLSFSMHQSYQKSREPTMSKRRSTNKYQPQYKQSIDSSKKQKTNSVYQNMFEFGQNSQLNHTLPLKDKPIVYTLQRYFEHLREIEKLQDELVSQQQNTAFDTKELLINFIKSEYLLKTSKHIEASLILTSLLENYKILMSHFPYKVIHLLKNIFEAYQIKSKEFDDFSSIFNPNIQMKVVIIYSYEKQYNQNCNQSLQFLSDVVNQILTSQKDKIGIVISNYEENFQQFYINLLKVTQIQLIMEEIIQYIQESITGQSVNVFINEEDLNDKNCSFDHKNGLKVSKIQEFNSKVETYENLQFSQPLNSQYIKNPFQSQKLIKTNQCNDTIQNENTTQCNLMKQTSQSPTMLTDLQHADNIHDMTDPLIQSKNQSPNTSYRFMEYKKQSKTTVDDLIIQQKINQLFGDEVNSDSQRESMIDSQFKELSIEQKNEIFYDSIKQTLNNYFIKNIAYRNSYMGHNIRDYLKQYKRINQTKQFSFLELLHLTNTWQEQKQKYIVYATNEISLIKDQTFEKMCQLLYYLNIQVIILCNQKGNCFLEQNSESCFDFNQRIIIQVFYESRKIINYLKFQRDNQTQNIHPTIIQHY